jgi:hypothetical protein
VEDIDCTVISGKQIIKFLVPSWGIPSALALPFDRLLQFDASRLAVGWFIMWLCCGTEFGSID